MKNWFMACELIELPGMPGTVQGVRKKLATAVKRKVKKGKGFEYHLNSLPAPTQNHLELLDTQALLRKIERDAEREDTAYQQAVEPDTSDAALDRLRLESTRERDRQIAKECAKRLHGLGRNHRLRLAAQARLWVISEWARRAREYKCKLRSCVDELCTDLITGDTTMPVRLMQHLPKLNGQVHVTKSTLYRWRKDHRAYGMGALLPKPAGRLGKGLIEQSESLQRTVLGAMWQKPHINATQMMEFLEVRCDGEIPSKATVNRYMTRWKEQNAQLWAYVTHPDRWKNVFMASQGSHHEGITALNQLWEADSTPADWMLEDGRHSVIGLIDMYSRRLKLRVSKTSKASAICASIRDAIIAWGLPDTLRTDNGRDYTSFQLVESLHALEIRHELCMPFASEQKGTIERVFRTMSHGVLELLPGFIGHSVAERKVIEARKSFAQRVMTPGEVIEVSMSGAELQQILDDWSEHMYGRTAHSGLDDRSPHEQAANWTQPIRTCDERSLDFLLSEDMEERVVTGKGVRYMHYYYISPEITEHIGRTVRLRRDPDRLDSLYIYDLDGHFIGIVQAPELSGIDRREAAVAAKHYQRKFLQQQKAEYVEHKKAVGKDIAGNVMRHKIEQSKKVVYMKPKTVEFDNFALQQARRALDAMDERDMYDQELAHDILKPGQPYDPASFKPRKITIHEAPEDDPIERHKRFMRIAQRIDTGELVSEDDKRRLHRYRQSPDYESMAGFFDDFGLDQQTGEPS